MTVETTTTKQTFAGGQASVTFSFKTLPDHPEYIAVKKKLTSTGAETDMTYSTDYTVSLESDGVGGTVTFSPTISTSYTLTVYRVTANTQSSDYDDYNQFPADTVENDLDRVILIAQERDEETNRALKLPITSTLTNVEIANPVASTFLGWNSSGTAITNYTLAQVTTTSAISMSAADVGKPIVVNSSGTDIAVISTEVLSIPAGVSVTGNTVLSSVTADSLYISSACSIATSLYVRTGATITTFSTDGTLTGNSDSTVPTEKAIKTYVSSASTSVNGYVGKFTRDLAAVSGDVAYTGVGFQPQLLQINCVEEASDSFSLGISKSTGEYCIVASLSTSTVNVADNIIIQLYVGAAGQYAVVKSMDADGFTLTWTKDGSPTGTIYGQYIAIK